MNKLNPNQTKFYEFLNGGIEKDVFEKWIYNNQGLEDEFPEDIYIDLNSFPFKLGDTKSYIRKLVISFYNYEEYELWRTINLLRKISENEIEIVLATRKLRRLYLEQEQILASAFITSKLGIGFESVLDECPIEAEYSNWSNLALKKYNKIVEHYKNDFIMTTKNELSKLLTSWSLKFPSNRAESGYTE